MAHPLEQDIHIKTPHNDSDDEQFEFEDFFAYNEYEKGEEFSEANQLDLAHVPGSPQADHEHSQADDQILDGDGVDEKKSLLFQPTSQRQHMLSQAQTQFYLKKEEAETARSHSRASVAPLGGSDNPASSRLIYDAIEDSSKRSPAHESSGPLDNSQGRAFLNHEKNAQAKITEVLLEVLEIRHQLPVTPLNKDATQASLQNAVPGPRSITSNSINHKKQYPDFAKAVTDRFMDFGGLKLPLRKVLTSHVRMKANDTQLKDGIFSPALIEEQPELDGPGVLPSVLQGNVTSTSILNHLDQVYESRSHQTSSLQTSIALAYRRSTLEDSNDSAHRSDSPFWRALFSRAQFENDETIHGCRLYPEQATGDPSWECPSDFKKWVKHELKNIKQYDSLEDNLTPSEEAQEARRCLIAATGIFPLEKVFPVHLLSDSEKTRYGFDTVFPVPMSEEENRQLTASLAPFDFDAEVDNFDWDRNTTWELTQDGESSHHIAADTGINNPPIEQPQVAVGESNNEHPKIVDDSDPRMDDLLCMSEYANGTLNIAAGGPVEDNLSSKLKTSVAKSHQELEEELKDAGMESESTTSKSAKTLTGGVQSNHALRHEDPTGSLTSIVTPASFKGAANHTDFQLTPSSADKKRSHNVAEIGSEDGLSLSPKYPIEPPAKRIAHPKKSADRKTTREVFGEIARRSTNNPSITTSWSWDGGDPNRQRSDLPMLAPRPSPSSHGYNPAPQIFSANTGGHYGSQSQGPPMSGSHTPPSWLNPHDMPSPQDNMMGSRTFMHYVPGHVSGNTHARPRWMLEGREPATPDPILHGRPLGHLSQPAWNGAQTYPSNTTPQRLNTPQYHSPVSPNFIPQPGRYGSYSASPTDNRRHHRDLTNTLPNGSPPYNALYSHLARQYDPQSQIDSSAVRYHNPPPSNRYNVAACHPQFAARPAIGVRETAAIDVCSYEISYSP